MVAVGQRAAPLHSAPSCALSWAPMGPGNPDWVLAVCEDTSAAVLAVLAIPSLACPLSPALKLFSTWQEKKSEEEWTSSLQTYY